jgi:hypothetical protein
MIERSRMLDGDTVYRIQWELGTDLLVGVCHCGAEHESEDPVELWEWLLAHPEGHLARIGPGYEAPIQPGPHLSATVSTEE